MSVPRGESKHAVKAIRDLTLKARFIQQYGADEAFFDRSQAYIKYWQDKLFYVDEKSFTQAVETGKLVTESPAQLDDASMFPDLGLEPQSETLFEQLRLQKTMNVQLQQDTNTALETGQTASLEPLQKTGVVLNTGGVIASVDWCPSPFNGGNYVAVSVLSNDGSIDDMVTSEDLSLFKIQKERSSTFSCIQIWSYDAATGEAKLCQLLNTSDFGVCSDLAWAPVVHSDILGILTGSFRDGNVHLFKIAKDGPQYADVVSSSFSYGLGAKPVPISAYAFLSTDRILVGTTEGTIAEFVLPNYFVDRQSDNEDDFDLSKPSFVVQVMESPISFLTVGSPSKDKWIVQANGYGNQHIAFDYDNFLHKRIESFDSFVQPIYHNALRVFVTTDGFESASYSFVRAPHERPTLMLKTDGVISALGTSKYLNHPLALVGNSFGEIYVVNFARRILAQGKTTAKLVVPLRLLKLVYKSKNTVLLDGDLEPVAPESAKTRLAISPPEVNISSISWNELSSASSLYAAGSHSGLLIIDHLGA